MKSFCLLVIITCVSLMATGQAKKDPIEFKGGDTAISGSIFHYLSKHNGIYMRATDEVRSSNKYFVVTFKMDSKGMIGKDASILSMQDTSIAKVVLNAVLQTNGQWINNTQKAKTVILPVYFIYKSDGREIEKGPVLKGNFYAGQSKDIVCLEPFVIMMYPEVH